MASGVTKAERFPRPSMCGQDAVAEIVSAVRGNGVAANYGAVEVSAVEGVGATCGMAEVAKAEDAEAEVCGCRSCSGGWYGSVWALNSREASCYVSNLCFSFFSLSSFLLLPLL